MQTNGSDISSTTGYQAIKPQWVKRLPSSDPVLVEKRGMTATPNKPLLEQTRSSHHSSGMLLQWASVSKAARGSATLLPQSKPQQPAPNTQTMADMPVSPGMSHSTNMRSDVVPLLSKPMMKAAAKTTVTPPAGKGRELNVPGRRVTARFYVDAEDFVAEHCFYVLASHADYIPAIVERFDAGEASAAGSIVRNPPCLILERGYPTLQEHLSNPASSWLAAPKRGALAKQCCNTRSMFMQLCESLVYLHGKGLVARGVSVEAAAFFENAGRWCFTDFASWARQGDEAPLDTPLRYAAPEAANIVRSLLIRQPDERASIKEVLTAAIKLEF
ncbi:hypothetical protein WJX84_007965 [Apatococcus fuscideae]|uniref:Protein kinase domain-containing protein n=1 Tax=Apatococcus fuscideae TaxID=2026836 RepID=A0AAW1TA05_9CHLO